MPPVGAYVSAFRVISERSTSSAQPPRYVDWPDHSCHHASCLLKRCRRVDGRWRGLPGGMIGEHEPHSLPRGDGELGRVLEIVALQRHVAAQLERLWTGRRREGTVHLAHPWPRSSVVETRIEARPHGHRAAHTLDHTHDTRVGRPWRHAVDDPGGTVGGLELSFEDEGGTAIAPRGPAHLAGGRDLPEPVLARPEQRREACG